MDYKKRNQYLIAGFLLSLLIVFQLGISKTIDTIRRYQQLEEATNRAMEEPREWSMLQERSRKVDRQWGYRFEEHQGTAFSFITLVADLAKKNKVLLRDFPQPTTLVLDNRFTVQTARIVISGPFLRLLDVVHQLEGVAVPGRIASLDFTTIQDRDKKKRLELVIYWQTMLQHTPTENHD